MSIPRVDLLIKDSRIASLSKDYGETYGIGQDFFIVALNKANLLIHTHIVTELPEAFVAYEDYTISGATESVTQPDDIFVTNYVYEARFKEAGQTYFNDPLEPLSYRGIGSTGAPDGFFLDAGRIYLDPIPSSGTLRVRYEQRINRLDYRRGQITSYAGTATNPTSIVLDDDDFLDSAAFTARTPEYVCVVDYAGTFNMKNIPIDSYDSSTRTLTIHSGFTSEAGETIPVGSFITFGANATTHSTLPDVAELFYIQFIQDEVNALLSSDDEKGSTAKQQYYLGKISEAFSLLPVTQRGIPSAVRR